MVENFKFIDIMLDQIEPIDNMAHKIKTIDNTIDKFKSIDNIVDKIKANFVSSNSSHHLLDFLVDLFLFFFRNRRNS